MTRPFAPLAAGLLILAACVPVPEVPSSRRPTVIEPPRPLVTTADVFPGLDPGGKELASLHFNVRAYGSQRTAQVAELAETLYNKIMLDTGLYSFKPRGLYGIIIYATRDEYLKKTQQPEWSGGVSVGNSIYTYENSGMSMTLAHEMTHLIFHEYMGSPRLEHRWINEGLAVYEENARGKAEGFAVGMTPEQKAMLRAAPLPFDQMINLVPATERERTVNMWYVQVGEVVRYLIETGGRNGFSQFLAELRNGKSLDESLRAAFPGPIGGAYQFEEVWKKQL